MPLAAPLPVQSTDGHFTVWPASIRFGEDLDERCLEPLASRVGQALLAHRWRLATAESCTGGGVAYLITSTPGSSSWFDEGVVSYANAAKHRLLGVPGEQIEAFGAVSETVVTAMAEGVRNRSGADIGLAISGVAGPDGGTLDKPVGLVWLAWASARGARAEAQRLDGSRRLVRLQAMVLALQGVLERLEKES